MNRRIVGIARFINARHSANASDTSTGYSAKRATVVPIVPFRNAGRTFDSCASLTRAEENDNTVSPRLKKNCHAFHKRNRHLQRFGSFFGWRYAHHVAVSLAGHGKHTHT